MELSDYLIDIRDNSAPENWFLRTKIGRSDVEIYGPDHKGVSIAIAKIDEVIAELKAKYTDPTKTYTFRGFNFKLPGSKVLQIINCLEEVPKLKAKFGGYKRSFG